MNATDGLLTLACIGIVALVYMLMSPFIQVFAEYGDQLLAMVMP